jgi:transcription elongation factor GreA
MATLAAARPTARYALSDAARGRLEAELSDLNAERALRASEAGSMCGDVADIAEFAARDMLLEHLDERMSRIRALLAESGVPQHNVADKRSRGADDTVRPGARLRMRIGGSDDAEEFVLGDRAERADDVGVITLTSPLGRALIGARAGDTVEYAAPAGTLQATVLDLRQAA